MSRPVLAEFKTNDTTGREWEAHLLGAELDAPGVMLPAALLRITVPKEMADPFGDGRTADFDVSDTPLVGMVAMMHVASPGREERGPENAKQHAAPVPPRHHDDAGRRGD